MSIFDEIEKESAKASSYIKMAAGEKRLFLFDINKISISEDVFQGEKKKRVCYKVADPNQPFDFKDFKIGFGHAKQLNALLRAGLTLIHVERIGSGLATKYTFAPAIKEAQK